MDAPQADAEAEVGRHDKKPGDEVTSEFLDSLVRGLYYTVCFILGVIDWLLL